MTDEDSNMMKPSDAVAFMNAMAESRSDDVDAVTVIALIDTLAEAKHELDQARDPKDRKPGHIISACAVAYRDAEKRLNEGLTKIMNRKVKEMENE